MANWPNIANPSLPISEKYADPALRSKSDGGYTMTRPRYTRVPRTWELKWPAMSHADYQTFSTFYTGTAIGGSVSFSWTCPTDGAAKTVRFAAEPKAEIIAWTSAGTPRLWAVGVTLEEV